MSHDPESGASRSVSTTEAPAAIGPYSQAVIVGDMVFVSGQIPLDPQTMTLVPGDVGDQARQVFRNLAAVARAAGGNLNDMVKLTLYLKDLADFQTVNSVMEEFFTPPFPARAAVGVADLPREADVEVEGIMHLLQAGSRDGSPGEGAVKASSNSEAE